MVRKFVVFFIIASLFLLNPINSVLASTDTAFTTTRIGDAASVAIRVGQAIGFDISGLIVPFFTKSGDIAQPDHESPADWKETSLKFMTPQEYKDDGKHVDWDEKKFPIFYTSLYGAILKTDADHSNHPPPTDCYISKNLQKSSDVKKAPLDFQTAQESDGWYGIVPVDPNASGIIDFNREVHILNGMNPNEDCKKNQIGYERDPLPNDIKAFSSFADGSNIVGQEIVSIFTIISKWIEDHWEQVKDYEHEPNTKQVILTEKKREPWYNCKTHDGGGPENEAGECSGDSPKTGGWTAFTLTPEDQKATEPASQQAYDISIVGFKQKALKATYDLMNIAQVRMEQAACYATPYTEGAAFGNIQVKFNIGKIPFNEMCNPPAETTQNGKWNCRTDLKELASSELNAAGQSYADTGIFDCADSKENAWKDCHNDVIDRARKACVDETFALAMWLHESGASNYKCSEQYAQSVGCSGTGCLAQDFGINIDSIAENFSAQLDQFLTLNYDCPHTIKDFFSVYSLGLRKTTGTGYQCYGDLTDDNRSKVDAYTSAIQDVYSTLGGGTLPAWPKAASCSQNQAL